jgi:hypothetical protein
VSLSEFWERLVGHLAFLLSTLPLFGAAMVAASAGLGRDVVRRTALTNVLLTCALSVLMVASYDPERRTEAGARETIFPGLTAAAAPRTDRSRRRTPRRRTPVRDGSPCHSHWPSMA